MEFNQEFGFNLKFEDFYTQSGLTTINQKFLEFLASIDPALYLEFCSLKNNHFEVIATSNILIAVARILEQFLIEAFAIQHENQALQARHIRLNKIYEVKREFIQRRIVKQYDSLPFEIQGFKILASLQINYQNLTELEEKLAAIIANLSKKEEQSALTNQEKEQLEQLINYSLWALFSNEGKKFHDSGALFKLPKKIDFKQLFPFSIKQENNLNICYNADEIRARDGFNLSDSGFNLNQALAHSHYCIFCHNQDKDSCSKGLKKPANQASCDSSFKIDPFGIELKGCPLDQKISEMNLLKSQGFSIAALAMAIIDNPMIAATGHRICNDCMKSCIYQKQEPVDIPQIETRTLKDVLNLPYGFEIYSLLTKWNPLNLDLALPKVNSGKKVLIVGLGPSGFTLAHYLLRMGHLVVAIDGLKIEPMDAKISSIDIYGQREKFKPIKLIAEIYEDLSKRTIYGFGGVAEYGITARWDKNYLTIIRLILERNQNFRMFGGLRFGSTITDETAFNYGFDHIALCSGAGRPNIIEIKNNYAKGIRSASDFLMSLQLNGAYKKELLTNLQIRIPIIVIGGGLTAIDTACEAQNYYLAQIEKFSKYYHQLAYSLKEEKILANLNEEEKIIAQEFLNHASELKEVRLKGGSVPKLLKKWGGVKILYRKTLLDSPAYCLNHQEVGKAFEEGIEFVENVTPLEAVLDEYEHIKQLKIYDLNQKEALLTCKSLLIAAGTSPNISAALEDKLDFKLEDKYFTSIKENDFFIKINPNQKAISFFGDLHPAFAGNVVKAMASAKKGHKQIDHILSKLPVFKDDEDFLAKINQEFLVTIKEVKILSDHAVEIVVKSKLLASQTKLGQIFRLQNYQALAPRIKGQIMAMEGIAVTALNIDLKESLISGIVIDTGGSTSLIKNFQEGEAAIFMGPTGLPTEIAKNETVMLVGGGRGNMPLAAIGQEYKKHGCRVIFFAGYRKNSHLIKQDEIEKASDVAIFAVSDEVVNLELTRPQDQQFQGNIIEAVINYGLNNSKYLPNFDFKKIDRIFTIGNEELMHKLSQIRHQELAEILNPHHIGIASLNAPMQCMLKGVCSRCLQKRINPLTKKTEYFYSCASQDQNMDHFDFQHLKWRCNQNSLVEKITKIQIATLLQHQ
jgi:NADPH-dependent glutamate synthase beta subunit-like oxidoreductase/NAD(P)H-flavin reductase